jgi:acyl carrier protein
MNERSLISCVEVQLGRRAVKLEDRFYEDLGAESVDMLHIMVAVESLTGIFIPEEVIPEFATVQDLFNYIKMRLQ